MINFFLRFSILGLCFSFFTYGCKPTSDSTEVKTLDNFAAGATIRVNSCSNASGALDSRWKSLNRINLGTELKQTLSAEVQKSYINEVEQYLKTIPAEMQDAYLSAGGEILLSSKAVTRCNQGYLSKTEFRNYVAEKRRDLLDSCLITAVDKDKDSLSGFLGVLAIYHQIDVSSIGKEYKAGAGIDLNQARLRHSGTRVFALAFGQYFTKLVQNTGNYSDALPFSVGPSDLPGMEATKEEIAAAFLEDLVAHNEAKHANYKLSNMEPFLGASGVSSVKNNISSAKTELSPDAVFKGVDTTSRQRFSDFVFAEAFDSFQCSSKTRSDMEKEFSKSFKQYQVVHPKMVSFAGRLAGLFKQTTVAAKPSSTAANGFGIATTSATNSVTTNISSVATTTKASTAALGSQLGAILAALTGGLGGALNAPTKANNPATAAAAQANTDFKAANGATCTSCQNDGCVCANGSCTCGPAATKANGDASSCSCGTCSGGNCPNSYTS